MLLCFLWIEERFIENEDAESCLKFDKLTNSQNKFCVPCIVHYLSLSFMFVLKEWIIKIYSQRNILKVILIYFLPAL